MIDVVLDTNCLIASLSRRGAYFDVWRGLQLGSYRLCISNEILEEYEEIIAKHANATVASNVIQSLINSPNVKYVTPYFHFHLIETDKDDNKFVDCAIAGNADFVVTEDAHFKNINSNVFPYVRVINIKTFLELLKKKQI